MEICKDNAGKIPYNGYPLIFVCKDGNTICHECAENAKQKCFEGDIYYEGPDIQCDNCGQWIKSAYGEIECNGKFIY